MNWLARLKKIDTTPSAEATEPTKPGFVGFVGFVAPGMAPMQKNRSNSPAANDPANSERDALENLTKPHIAAAAIDPAPAPAPDPDRWAWPHSQAMTGREIDTFTAQLHHFTRRGLAEPDAERVADKLVTRDREADDRRLCLECVHLAGHTDVWGCRNWQRAGVATKTQHAPLSAALVIQPQRCDGFMDQNQQETIR